MHRPLIIGMNPAPHFRDVAWHPEAYSTRLLAFLAFGHEGAVNELFRHFELVNLNRHIVDEDDLSVLDKDEAWLRLSEWEASGALRPERTVLLLGGEVREIVDAYLSERRSAGMVGPQTIAISHPASLHHRLRKTPKKRLPVGTWNFTRQLLVRVGNLSERRELTEDDLRGVNRALYKRLDPQERGMASIDLDEDLEDDEREYEVETFLRALRDREAVLDLVGVVTAPLYVLEAAENFEELEAELLPAEEEDQEN